MPGIPFSFHEAFWSDPLGLVPGALPASPPNAGKGSTVLLQAAIPAALPASAAALLHVWAGDVLRLRDGITKAPVSFDITGVFAPRQGAAQRQRVIPARGN